MHARRTNNTARALLLLTLAAAGAAAAPAALAGPLSPPVGPITSTGKTLTQVEPRIPISSLPANAGASAQHYITQPGSYYLTGDIFGAGGQNVIRVAASNVTIDLCGFTIIGGATGIRADGNFENLTVKNGTITNVTLHGILAYAPMDRTVVENMHIASPGGTGIHVGFNSAVRDCRVTNSGGSGIIAGSTSVIESCIVDTCAAAGFMLSYGSRVTDCTARAAVTGFLNGGSGNRGTILTNCVADVCTDGFDLNEGVLLDGCSASGCSRIGISAGAVADVRDCKATYCGQQGIVVGNNSVLTGCSANRNGTSGSYAGIWINGNNCRVENNTAIANGYGIYTTGTGNFIARNVARSNPSGNFSISASNELAPIVTNPGANNFSTMTPWSNVAY